MAEQHRGCDLVRLSAYRDGELDRVEQQKIRKHLEGCSSCRSALDEYAHLGAGLQGGRVTPPRMLHRELRGRLESPRPRPWSVGALPGLAAAASVALVVWVVVGGPGSVPLAQHLGPAVPLGAEPGRVDVSSGSGVQALDDRVAARQRPVAADECAEPLPGVAVALAQLPEVRTGLGCATDAARVLSLVSQTFERGSLLRRGDTREVYAITEDGRWRLYADPGPSAQAASLSDAGGRLELGNWFRPVWSVRPDLRPMLGQVVESQQQLHGLVQPYEGGLALWDAGGRVYLLLDGGSFLRYLDDRAMVRNQGAASDGI